MRHRFEARPIRGFVAKVAGTIERRRLVAPDEKVLVALSGGPDSTALVAALAALRDAGRIAGVVALHVDHGLRAGSELDAACAEVTCRRLGVPFEAVRVTVGQGNVQAAARRARYRALGEAAERLGAQRIATGHTRTDQAETFLMRALRGAGARGLSSIPPRRGSIVRPLIDLGRDEVLAWLEQQGLRWREDPTNSSPRFLRNALRAQVAPTLRRLEPGFERALARAADLLRDDERALSRRARKVCSAEGAVVISDLADEPRAVRRRVVRRLWRRASRGARALPAERIDAIVALCARARPGRLALPGRLEARVTGGKLSIGPPLPAAVALPSVRVDGPGRFRLGAFAVELAIDDRGGSTAPPWPLFLRGRLPGDRFRPERARGGKKLKAWLIDEKVPRERRDRLVVLADGEGNVLALPQLGIRAAGAGSLDVSIRPASEP